MTWQTAFVELNDSVEDHFGESVNYLSLNGLTAVTGITATLNRGGDDGKADFMMPTESVATPGFGDSLTDGDGVVWRIYEAMQKYSNITPCDLRRSEYWHSVVAEYYRTDTEVWATHTSGLTVHIENGSSVESLEPEDSNLANQFVLKTLLLASVTHKMRFKWGSRYLYVTGKRTDDTGTRWTLFDCVEDEA